MGLLNWLGFGLVPSAVPPLSVASWDAPDNSQAAIVLSDIFAETVSHDLMPISRPEALTIPAVAAAHTTLVSAFGNLQLVAKRGTPLPSQPTWLTQTGRGQQPWYLRNARTYADFMFLGFSLWQCERGADTYPTEAWHVPYGRWTWDDNGTILIDEQPVDADSVILFESMLPGLLNTATRTLHQALEFERTIAERARVSTPLTILRRTDDVDIDPTEVKTLLDGYKKAREARDGSTVAFVPSGYELTIEAEPAGAWLLEARNAVAADVAKHTGIPASRLGSTTAIDSLTYTTQLGEFTDLLTQTAHLYLDPIEARLSLGDVTPGGQTVEFNKTPLDAALLPVANQPQPDAAAHEGKLDVQSLR
ncbi:phage portal protein [Humibacter albus]|uniref:phage portal protein n=1 Tax=Humibacter albus TaxID=427754 RepID=UPI0003B48C88|nr:phage portal protein [Humibacter albus]